jgi:TetR/AcrR family transcriptional repressor of nem operon
MARDTKTALLDSAEWAARTRGFDGFSYKDLAEDVGIRKASIHHHFPTKALLSEALMQRYYTHLEAGCAEIEETYDQGGARLSALIAQYRLAINDGKCLCLCVSFSSSRESLPQEAITEIRRFRKMIIAWLAKAFALGAADGSIADVRDPNQEAAAAMSLLEGAQLAARAQEMLPCSTKPLSC